MRELALKEVERSLDDFDATEYLLRTTDEFWFISYCLDQLHQLPSSVAAVMGCREYTTLQAHAIVKGVYERLARDAAESARSGSGRS